MGYQSKNESFLRIEEDYDQEMEACRFQVAVEVRDQPPMAMVYRNLWRTRVPARLWSDMLMSLKQTGPMPIFAWADSEIQICNGYTPLNFEFVREIRSHNLLATSLINIETWKHFWNLGSEDGSLPIPGSGGSVRPGPMAMIYEEM
ncbi:conserved hypothetical protein [Ricinus communis]|uniref:Uncharacterized protein n=1 Tax=Ricinus communis TaxID=3988 RepID=B9SN85_RICCO|nr:conserved hypothetical protein [Ricinus communis]